MSDLEATSWNEQIDLCVSSPADFRLTCPEILTNIKSGNTAYWDVFFTKISSIITKNSFTPLPRLYGLYLLFIATETCQPKLGAYFAEKKELLSWIAESAYHDSSKRQLAVDQRGRFFFSSAPSAADQRIGIKFIRLCTESVIVWNHNFGTRDQDDPCYAYYSNSELLRRKITVPSKYWFIGQHIDTVIPEKAALKKLKGTVQDTISMEKTIKLMKPTDSEPADGIIKLHSADEQNSEKDSSVQKISDKDESSESSISDDSDDEKPVEKSKPEPRLQRYRLKAEQKQSKQQDPVQQAADTEDNEYQRYAKHVHAAAKQRVSVRGADHKASGQRVRIDDNVLDIKKRFTTLSSAYSEYFNNYSSPTNLTNSKVYQKQVTIDLEAVSSSIVKSESVRSSGPTQSKVFASSKTVNLNENKTPLSKKFSMIFEDRVKSPLSQSKIFRSPSRQITYKSQTSRLPENNFGLNSNASDPFPISQIGATSLEDLMQYKTVTLAHSTSKIEANNYAKEFNGRTEGSLNEILEEKDSQEGFKSVSQIQRKITSELILGKTDSFKKTANDSPFAMSPRKTIIKFGFPCKSSE